MSFRDNHKLRFVPFELRSQFQPAGDQPQAIETLHNWISRGEKFQTLLGVTGSGKTFTMANVIARLNKPTLVIAPNKTLAAQLYSEFKEFFPDGRVRYFVSYYDYYQPEAYVPSTDTYIEKDSAINEEIDRMRHAATRAILEGSDTIIVASVSCIYGLGAPEDYFKQMLFLEVGQTIPREELLKKLVSLQYTRSELEFKRGSFRVRGDSLDIFPADEEESGIRVTMFGNEVEELREIDALSGASKRKIAHCAIYPVSHFVTDKNGIEDRIEEIKKELKDWLPQLINKGRVLEAQRLESRTMYDMDLLKEVGFCPGVENYSRQLAGRPEGAPPTTLIDYFPSDFLLVIDESHVTVSQLGGMYRGDRSRKQTLVDYGFRLPSALDNRPLKPEEFWDRVGQTVFVSATPADYELEKSGRHVVEQINRPTGVLDPKVEIRPATHQIDDLIGEIRKTIELGDRVIVTTLTKKMAEHLADYLREIGIKCKYLHSDINAIERVEIIRGLRQGEFDVLIGINLLREGLDLVEVSLVAILDADKEGFLRSTRSLIQTMGRAARNIRGRVIMYADKMTDSMKSAIQESDRRRMIQEAFNKKHGIEPSSARRSIDAPLSEIANDGTEALSVDGKEIVIPRDEGGQNKLILQLKKDMFEAASKREFEKAALLRDTLQKIQQAIMQA